MNDPAQAQQLEPLTIGQLAWVLKNLPDKACGPDAVTAQLLRTAPQLKLSCGTWELTIKVHGGGGFQS